MCRRRMRHAVDGCSEGQTKGSCRWNKSGEGRTSRLELRDPRVRGGVMGDPRGALKSKST